MEICIFFKTPKINSYTILSRFNKQPEEVLRDHLSVILVPMVTMIFLIKCVIIVLVLKSNKYQSWWEMSVYRGLKINLLHIQLDIIWLGVSM